MNHAGSSLPQWKLDLAPAQRGRVLEAINLDGGNCKEETGSCRQGLAEPPRRSNKSRCTRATSCM